MRHVPRASLLLLLGQIALIACALVGIALDAETAALGCALLATFIALPSSRGSGSCASGSDVRGADAGTPAAPRE
jgi:hypothetical protein